MFLVLEQNLNQMIELEKSNEIINIQKICKQQGI